MHIDVSFPSSVLLASTDYTWQNLYFNVLGRLPLRWMLCSPSPPERLLPDRSDIITVCISLAPTFFFNKSNWKVWVVKSNPWEDLMTPVDMLSIPGCSGLMFDCRYENSLVDLSTAEDSFKAFPQTAPRPYLCVSRSVVSQLCDSGLNLPRLLCPWDFPAKNSGENRHSFSRVSS